jgi:uncharacterized protein (DUF58 family)
MSDDSPPDGAVRSGTATSSTRGRFSPGPHLPWLAAAAVPLAFLGGGGLAGVAAAAALDGALGVGALLEARALRRRVPVVRRELPGRLVVGLAQSVTLELHNRSGEALKLRVRDNPPPGFEAEPEEQALALPPFGRRALRYELIPRSRGDHRFGPVSLRLEGAAGLSAITLDQPLEEAVRVYPNVLGARRAELAGRLGDLRSLGSRSVRATGGGGDFAQLREYVEGDPFRHLSWKATAKRGRPVTRVFEQERSQQLVLCLDVGRMMATEIDGAPKLDHALSAALLLAWVALHNGDRVGAVVFSDAVHRFVPPGRGIAHYRHLLDALYDLTASKTYVDFRRLSELVRAKVQRRSLLVIFSDLFDEAQASPLLEHAAMLRGRHLPLCVTMADPAVGRRAAQAVQGAGDVYARAAAIDVLEERDALERKLRKSAIGWLEAPAGALGVATIRRYLAIKSRKEL